MLIAVSADGRETSSPVSGQFENCRWLLIVDTDDNAAQLTVRSVEPLENTDGAQALADTIIERDCEAVITGVMTPALYNVFANACVTRYTAPGLSVMEALESMDRNTLAILRDEDNVCQGDHSGGECNCGEDHH
jgi:predicted Fe-Mo cluster-binding NifX family protein